MIPKEKVIPGGRERVWIVQETVVEEESRGRTSGCFSAFWLRSSAVYLLDICDFCLNNIAGGRETPPGLRQTSIPESNRDPLVAIALLWGMTTLISVPLLISTKVLLEAQVRKLCSYTRTRYSGVMQYVLKCCKRETSGLQKHSAVG